MSIATEPYRSTFIDNNDVTHDWEHLKLASPGVRLVYARWSELVDERGPVSYQAPVAGAPQLLREWLDAVATLEETGRGKWLQIAVEDELFGVKHGTFGTVRGTLRSAPVIRDAFRSAVDLAQQRKVSLNPSGSASPEAQNRRLKALAVFYGHELDSGYLAAAIARLRQLVKTRPGSRLRRSDADELGAVLTAFVSELLSRGFALSFLREHLDVLDGSENTKTEALRWRAFLDRLTRPPRQMNVAVVAQSNKDFWAHWPGGTAAHLSELPLFASAELPESNKTRKKFKRYFARGVVEYEVEALDHHAAANLAIRQLERTADLITAEAVHPKPDVLATATRHGRGRHLKFSFATNADLPLTPLPSGLTELAKKGYAQRMMEADIERSSLVRLEGALRAYRISQEATYTRTGLTNLWTALEALTPEEKKVTDKQPPSIIEQVTSMVGPLMGSFKAESLVDDFIGVLRRGGVLGTQVDRALLVQLLSTKDGAEWVGAMTRDDPIVGLHARQFSETMRTPANVVAASYRTARRVEWQVRRLYRLRNETVHGAATPQNARRVLQHLMLYVNRAVLVLSDLLLDVSNGLRTIEDAVSAVEVSYFEWATWARGLVIGKNEATPTAALKEDDVARLLRPPFRRLVEQASG